eukprot:Hpha_TRINITY_DN14594_c0_g1::TRINITY_DN14594_c0_g1_i1::g.46624::m.46624
MKRVYRSCKLHRKKDRETHVSAVVIGPSYSFSKCCVARQQQLAKLTQQPRRQIEGNRQDEGEGKGGWVGGASHPPPTAVFFIDEVFCFVADLPPSLSLPPFFLFPRPGRAGKGGTGREEGGCEERGEGWLPGNVFLFLSHHTWLHVLQDFTPPHSLFIF